MNTFRTILQGSDATKKNAYDFARGFDFSEEESGGYDKDFRSCYIDTVNGIEIYYNMGADYYFFAPAEDTNKTKIIDTFNRRNLEVAKDVHDESKGYVFKCTDGTFVRFSFEVVNELSNLGANINRSLL